MATHTLIQHMLAGSAYQNIEWVKTIPSTFLDEKAFDYPLNLKWKKYEQLVSSFDYTLVLNSERDLKFEDAFPGNEAR